MPERKVYNIKELNLELINPSTKNYKKESQGGSKIVVIGKPGCFVKGTPVLMYDGSIKPVEDVEVGDKVMGDNSTPRNVLELCRNFDEMFKIKMENSESYTVNKNHKLVLKRQHTKYNDDIVEITVKEYIEKQDTLKDYKLYKNRVKFPPKQLDINIDPYMFGVWIVEKPKENYITKLVKSKIQETKFLESVEKYNLIENKHIPHELKCNSPEIINNVLSGIIDSVGILNNIEEFYTIKTKHETLAKDIQFMTRSLGICCDITEDNNIFSLKLHGNIYLLKSSIFRPLPPSKRFNNLFSFHVEPVGIDNYYGFTLDDNHRFLLGSFDVVRNTGKSTLITSLLYAKKHIFPSALVISGTEDSNHHYQKIIPDSFIYNKYDEEVIETFVRRQKIAKEHLSNPWSVLLLDDCTDDPKVFARPLQQGLYKNGRHWKMLYILSLQYGMDIRPVIRTNIDGVFILRESNLRNRKILWENYAGCIPDFQDFCSIMDQITDDYTALYVNNATQSNDLRDCIFWYKAPMINKKWRFGCEEIWMHHDARYNKNYVPSVI